MVKELKIKPRSPDIPFQVGTDDFQIYADLAASAQKLLEDLLFKIFRYAYELTNETNFLFSGGVAMNSSAVRKTTQLDFIKKLNLPPSPGDSGAAIGAAYYGYIDKVQKIVEKKQLSKNIFPGKINSNEDFFELVFEKIADKNNSIDKVAEIVSQDEIVAICYSNIETGPRALGHRSLICNAHKKELIKILSTDIKKRNIFRPTAPAVLKKDAESYFNLNEKLMNCYTHMAATATPKDNVLQDIAGVIHVDKSSRVQICEEDSLLGRILMSLNKYKIRVIANTSFNISSDPMVYDKEDAFLAVERMGIKYLLTETGLYKRK